MDSGSFKLLVAETVESLPEYFKTRLDNVDIIVEDYPTPEQLSKAGVNSGSILLGLYEGIPLTRRSSAYGLVTPDKITIFQKPVEAKCRNREEIIAEIKKVVEHEIAHHFGISDARIQQLQNEKRNKDLYYLKGSD